MPIADVLMVDSSPTQADPGLAQREPPLSREVEVSPGISLACVKPEIAERVMAATGFRASSPRHRTAMYAFVRYDPPGREWDSDHEITKLLFLSHFVRANEAGFEYSARIVTAKTGDLTSIEPANVAPPFARAYCLAGARGLWLTQADAVTLRDLGAAYKRVYPLLTKSRVGVAVSAFAGTPFILFENQVALLLATILEGLVSTMPQRASRQFATRVPDLAREVELPELDRAWAEKTYSLRSKLAHGGPRLPSVGSPDRAIKTLELDETIAKLDELLRRILRKALLDDAFRGRVESIDTRLPVPGVGCPKCRSTDDTLIPVRCPSCQGSWR